MRLAVLLRFVMYVEDVEQRRPPCKQVSSHVTTEARELKIVTFALHV
jgi:hypothetical protein